MRRFRNLRHGLLLVIATLTAAPTAAVTVTIEYDPTNALGLSSPFFNSGTTQANQAKIALDAAAAFYSNLLTDTLDAIMAPTYTSPRVSIAWNWTMGFSNPNGAGNLTRTNQVIAADEFRIFAGAQTFSGSTLASSAPGYVASWGRPGIPPGANSTDIEAIQAIDAAFQQTLETRGEPSGFEAWGGTISFDNDTNWHFQHTTAPPMGKTDFYTVALHEIGHVLGFGTAPEFQTLIAGSNFNGMAAKASYGGPVPLYFDNGHWADGTTSVVYGTGTPQTAIMVPSLPPATRRHVTAVDVATLSDVGWSIASPAGDYNRNGVVDAADYVLWRDTRGQNVPAGTGADGDGDGNVGITDYTFWRARFGNAIAASGAAVGLDVGAAPEPASVVLAMLAFFWLYTSLRHRG
jgi:hypothetical protein